MTTTSLDNDAVDKRLTDLEVKSSFSEDLLDHLNQVIVRQQQDIDWLVGQVRQLRAQMPDSGTLGASAPEVDLPPHY